MSITLNETQKAGVSSTIFQHTSAVFLYNSPVNIDHMQLIYEQDLPKMMREILMKKQTMERVLKHEIR